MKESSTVIDSRGGEGSMSSANLEKRLEALEAEVAALKQQVNGGTAAKRTWLDEAWGAFANDPLYVEAMQLGAEWRRKENEKSLRPQKKTKKKRKNVRS
jgi:nitroreductase